MSSAAAPPCRRPERAPASVSSLDTTQTSYAETPGYRSDPAWALDFRGMVADALEERWPTRARRIRECGKAAIRMECQGCGSAHLFPVRCAARTCPTCAPRGARAITGRLLERIKVHDEIVEDAPWEGPGDPRRGSVGDRNGRAWMLVTLTSPAPEDEARRWDPDRLSEAVARVSGAISDWWRSTPWGDWSTLLPGRRVRRDTSYAAALEIAPGGMVHVHALVYGEFVPQEELARRWGEALGMDGPAVVDVRAVQESDPTSGLREALKYATKGDGSRGRQAVRAAAVECALQNVRRVRIGGRLYHISDESTDPGSDDVQEEDVHDHHEAACESCGLLGEWEWTVRVPSKAVEMNGGWGLVGGQERAPP